MNATPNDAVTLRELYERDSNKVLQSGWSLSWWRHGGEPGPDWLSDKIDLTAKEGNVTGRYTRARNAPVPPFAPKADEFTGTVPTALAEQLFRAIFAVRLYERSFPSEARAGLADAVQQSFELDVGSLHLAKILYEPSRAELGELGAACESVAAHLRDAGLHRDVSPR